MHANTHSGTHMLYSHARRHTTRTCKHTQACSAWGRGHILSLVLINGYKPQTRKVSVCAAYAGQSIHRKSILFQDYVLVLHIYYHCIRLISPLQHVLFTSSRQRLAGINILLWSFLTRIIIHMIMWIDLYSEMISPLDSPYTTLPATIKAIKREKTAL